MIRERISKLATLCMTLTLLAGMSTSAWTAQTKHALLIGIQDHGDGQFESLRGPRNDIGLIEELLQRRFGIPDSSIRTLLDREATHTAVRHAFAELARSVEEGDLVYVHYAGHGSRTKDLNGDERGGEDQTWATCLSSRRTLTPSLPSRSASKQISVTVRTASYLRMLRSP